MEPGPDATSGMVRGFFALDVTWYESLGGGLLMTIGGIKGLLNALVFESRSWNLQKRLFVNNHELPVNLNVPWKVQEGVPFDQMERSWFQSQIHLSLSWGDCFSTFNLWARLGAVPQIMQMFEIFIPQIAI